jgi:hypothetical protein
MGIKGGLADSCAEADRIGNGGMPFFRGMERTQIAEESGLINR